FGQLMEMCLGFLQADEVRLLSGEPLEEPLAGRGANAAAVHCDDAHRGRILGYWKKVAGGAFFGTSLAFPAAKSAVFARGAQPPASARRYARANNNSCVDTHGCGWHRRGALRRGLHAEPPAPLHRPCAVARGASLRQLQAQIRPRESLLLQ